MQVTPLYPIYQKYGAKVVDFHQWSLPLQFNGIIEEHHTVRKKVGIFDVSHMGEILVEGKDAAIYLEYVLTNRIEGIKPGFIRYSPMCAPDGGTIDDLLVYCIAHDRFLVVVNASNIDQDFLWLDKNRDKFEISIRDVSSKTGQIAIQGPNSVKIMEKITQISLNSLKYYQFYSNINFDGIQILLSRTGYTGEDGFEIYCQSSDAVSVWEKLMETGADYGIQPVGLGARDTLRLEACLPLYGNELSLKISPLEAGLERFVKLDKADFIGKNWLVNQASTNEKKRRLIGIEMVDRGIPRSGYQIYFEGNNIGEISSGSFCPSLNKNMGLGLVDFSESFHDRLVQVEIRGKLTNARVVSLPFYSRLKGGEQ